VLYSFLTAETGKAYQIKDILRGRFYYPRDPGEIYRACGRGAKIQLYASDGLGESSDSPRALKEGEIGEWILLDGVSPGSRSSSAPSKNDNRQTPASCSNVALHNLYPGEIDLLVCCRRRAPHIQGITLSVRSCSIQLSGPNLGRNTSCESVA
jgi:hypothetical protein